MSYRHGSRVKATSTTTGVGTLTIIDGAAEFRTFDGAFGAGPAKCQYVIRGTTYYEIGVGTWDTAANTLARDYVIVSSAGTTQVSLPAATHDVFLWEVGTWPTDVLTGSPTLTITDLFSMQFYSGVGGTLALPALSTLPRGICFPVINRGSGSLTIDPNGADLVNGAATVVVGVGQGGWIFIKDQATAEWCTILGVVANPVATDVANTFTAAQAFNQPVTITGSSVTPLTRTSTDAGAGQGPIDDIFRDSASPAASDLIGATQFNGRSSTGVKRTYVEGQAEILDATNASEDARYKIRTIVAGTLADRVLVGQGLFTVGATGGDKGANAINAGEIWDDGVSLEPIRATSWAQYALDTGAAVVGESRNTSSISRSAVGFATVNFSTVYSGADKYALSGMARRTATNSDMVVAVAQATAPTASAVSLGAVVAGSGDDVRWASYQAHGTF